MKYLRKIPKNMWLPLVLAVSFNMMTYFGTRILTAERYHYDLSNQLDDKIPFVPWTVTIYFCCYVFWILNYLLGCMQEKKTAFRFISADFAAKAVCLICFLVFPTTNTRPLIEGTSVWEVVMGLLYRADAADNLFPSIHCLTSWFCFIAVRENKKIPMWYKIASLLFALSVCVSTLMTKQHVMIDAIAGVALAEGSYFLVEKIGFSHGYRRCISKVNRKILRRSKVNE